MSECPNCGYEVRPDTKHNADGEGHCQIVEVDTEWVVGFANRKPAKQMYKK
jgi:hypothetical protein